jgi:hypothetical protein
MSAPTLVTAAPDSAPRGGPAPSAAAPQDNQSTAPGDVLVRAENLGKCYRIYKRPLDRVLEWTIGGQRHKPFWAVRNVSFEVRRGECLGIIGANGSGKSTILKMLTGALWPTEGSAGCEGRVLSLIELGTGLNPQLSGRANILNTAALLNFPPDYARGAMDEIEALPSWTSSSTAPSCSTAAACGSAWHSLCSPASVPTSSSSTRPSASATSSSSRSAPPASAPCSTAASP